MFCKQDETFEKYFTYDCTLANLKMGVYEPPHPAYKRGLAENSNAFF